MKPRYRHLHMSLPNAVSILTIIVAFIMSMASAYTTHHNGLSIWILNIAGGGHSALRTNTIRDRIMQGNSDNFILTDTQSGGAIIHARWDWQNYQIRETPGIRKRRRNRHRNQEIPTDNWGIQGSSRIRPKTHPHHSESYISVGNRRWEDMYYYSKRREICITICSCT
jgi:hypothetical protein